MAVCRAVGPGACTVHTRVPIETHVFCPHDSIYLNIHSFYTLCKFVAFRCRPPAHTVPLANMSMMFAGVVTADANVIMFVFE